MGGSKRVKAGSTMRGAGGMVYIIRMNGLYKIGWSTRPLERLKALQTGVPYELELVGTIEGDLAAERIWHHLFRDKHVRGEWFALAPEDVKAILAIDDGIDPYPLFDDE